MNTKVYKNNKKEPYIILCEENRQIKNKTWVVYLVQFLNTGSTKWVYKCNQVKGKLRDDYAASYYNIGYTGELKSKHEYWKRAKELWRNMLKRCYTDDPKGYQKWGTTVDKSWHCFAVFLEDIKELDNFDKWLEGNSRKLNNYNLDKDLKIPNSNIYSKHTCSFVHESINKSEGAKTTVDGYYRTVGGKA